MYIRFLLAVRLLVAKRKLSIETEDVEFFGENELPDLSIARNTEWQIKEMFAYMKDPIRKKYLIN